MTISNQKRVRKLKGVKGTEDTKLEIKWVAMVPFDKMSIELCKRSVQRKLYTFKKLYFA